MDINTLKNKILTSTTLSETEKKEWLFLLPKMSQEQREELDGILTIKIPQTQHPVSPLAPITPVKPIPPISKPELKPMATPATKKPFQTPSYLPGQVDKIRDIKPEPKPETPVIPIYQPKPWPVAKSTPTAQPSKPISPIQTKPPLTTSPKPSPVTPTVQSGQGMIKKTPNPELLKIQSISLPEMRKETSPYNYLERVLNEIKSLIQMRRITVSQVEEALEQSPLYKIYMQEGLNRMNGQAGSLSQEEFECLTDFRHALKKLG